MKQSSFSAVIGGAVLVAAAAMTVPAQSPPSIDAEIAQLRKELSSTQADCQRVYQEIDQDKKDFADYRTRAVQKLTAAGSELDAVKTETAKQARSNDSLASRIASVQSQIRQIEMSQDEFRVKLISLCGSLSPAIHRLPPLVMTQTQSAVSLLTNDLATKSVDNVEGCTRLIQILTRLDDVTSSIQIAEENSPVPDIRGMAYRLRFGSFFEAVVDTKGEKCAVFDGWSPDGSAKWKTLDGSSAAAALLAAVNIREGKALPAFVSLPLVASPAPVVAQGGAK